MPDHKFKPGQTVTLLSSRAAGPAPRGNFEIVRLMPVESNDRKYRIKNALDGHERMVSESQLVRTEGFS